MDILSYKIGKNASGGGGSLDWTSIGFESQPTSISIGYNYAIQIKENFSPTSSMFRKYYQDYKLMFFPTVNTSSTTNFSSMFENCYGLIEVALFDTSKASNFANMFSGCRALRKVPQFDLAGATNVSGMFSDCRSLVEVPIFNFKMVSTISSIFSACYSLNDESLNNIMASCITATGVASGNKKLSILGFSGDQATRCQSLSNYSAFTSAGWTTGY